MFYLDLYIICVDQISGLLTGTSGRVRVKPSRVAGTTGKGRAGKRARVQRVIFLRTVSYPFHTRTRLG